MAPFRKGVTMVVIKRNTMNEKRKARLARRQAEEEKQGKAVVTWLFTALVALALLLAVIFLLMQ